jgi:predicted nucleotidyltransferase component of viral defense system
MAKNIGHSIKARLLNASDHNNRRYQQLLVRYMQEGFLRRLSMSPYSRKFILKGGALLYAFDEFLPRPTLDIDFMGTGISNDKSSIIDAFKEIAEITVEDDGVVFIADSIDASDIAVEKKYPGVRITVEAHLDTVVKELTFDIGFGDVIKPRPLSMEYPVIFSEMKAPELIAYSLETVVAEKFQTMIDRGEANSRMKDYYDLYRIILSHKFDENDLLSAIIATFDNRKTEYIPNHQLFSDGFANNPLLVQRWNNYRRKLEDIKDVSFDTVMMVIGNFMKPYWEKLQK